MPRRPLPSRKSANASFALPFSGQNAAHPTLLSDNQRLQEIGAIMARAILRKRHPARRT